MVDSSGDKYKIVVLGEGTISKMTNLM